jgi:hypothetical protein
MEVMTMKSMTIYQRTIQGIMERPIKTTKLLMKRYSHPLGMQFALSVMPRMTVDDIAKQEEKL